YVQSRERFRLEWESGCLRIQTRFSWGENTLLHYAITNTGTEPFRVDVGGDYRGGTRPSKSNRTRPLGSAAAD
ncbi:MAG: hypothetical protein ACKVHO_16815, partial [Verrucomicrobiia bacterium]